ncbi:MAG: hypothetical protein KAT43_03735 [Nanoarchaeota archaeon]|nr:hypothetical protein [Nanoarchaeota archaeon]
MDDITIRINSRSIERIVWIIIVILLIAGMVYMYFSDFGCDGTTADVIDEPEDDTGTDDETDTEDEADVEDEAEDEPEPEDDTGTDDETDDEDPTAATVKAGELELTVDIPIKVKNTMLLRKDSQYEVKGTDYAKLTAIYFTINNNKKSFIPRIEVFVYDTDDNQEDYKEILTFTSMIDKGKIFDKVERVNIGFNEINESKIFEVVLRDESGVLLDRFKKVMTFD